MDYSDSNITLSDSLSGYITANEGECDNSRYLSVLSHDLTLQEMNVTLSDEQIEEDNGTELLCTEENQPLIFTVDGTNEIYGIQMAQDEDGNLRKYQIQYSETMNGELVPMLETIQLLPLDYEEQVISAEETYSSSELSQSNDTFVITNDEIISHNSKNHFNKNKNMGTEEQNHIQGDVKRLNIPSTSVTSYKAPVKNEPEELFDRSSGMETADENDDETQNSIGLKEEAVCEGVLGMEDAESTVVAIQHLEFPQSLEQEELYEETIEEKHFEQLFLEENHIIDTNQLIRNDIIVEDDQQNELYQVLNTVASDPENVYDHSMHTILKETIDHPKTNILKKPIQKSLLKDFINTEQKIVYVHTLPEKENLTLMDIESFTKPSSRSLLKCNQPTEPSDHLLMGDEHPQKNLSTKAVSRTKELKQPQTYLRTKEAKQAQQFLNFINSTTIPQVPERKGRLPRKQQIKPVKHPDEDIVVKEMIVSSNSFIEPISAEERKYLPVTEYVELIDSGDERCNNKKKRKSNDQDEFIEIEISDTDESDIGEVELEPTMNGKVENEAPNGIKKKRGRPPKNQTSLNEKKDAYPNSPPKISRLDNDVESVTSTLQVIRMENDEENASDSTENSTKYQNCNEVDKLSARHESSGSDSTNEQHDSSKEKSSQSDAKRKVSLASNKVETRKVFEYKYECEMCKTKFINKFLQSRHNCISKVKSTFSCDICQQKFTNVSNLNLHKKTHIKEPPIIRPTLTKIPPVKQVSKKDTVLGGPLVKSSLSSSRSSMISKAPVKIPSRQSILPAKHPKPSIKGSRVSLLPPKSKQLVAQAIHLPKHSTQIKIITSEVASESSVQHGNDSNMIEENVSEKNNTTIFKCEKQCENCSMRFENHSSWFNHQVLKHGLKTPDKSIGEKKVKRIVKDKVVHNGIRTAPTVAKNFSMLKNMVQHI